MCDNASVWTSTAIQPNSFGRLMPGMLLASASAMPVARMARPVGGAAPSCFSWSSVAKGHHAANGGRQAFIRVFLAALTAGERHGLAGPIVFGLVAWRKGFVEEGL